VPRPPCAILLSLSLFLTTVSLEMLDEQLRKYLLKPNLSVKKNFYFQKKNSVLKGKKVCVTHC